MRWGKGTLAGLGLLVSMALGDATADVSNGKALHENHCVRCHDSTVYTRPDRRVDDLPALEAQVRRCDSALGTTWFDDEIADVVEYLNAEYYKF